MKTQTRYCCLESRRLHSLHSFLSLHLRVFLFEEEKEKEHVIYRWRNIQLEEKVVYHNPRIVRIAVTICGCLCRVSSSKSPRLTSNNSIMSFRSATSFRPKSSKTPLR